MRHTRTAGTRGRLNIFKGEGPVSSQQACPPRRAGDSRFQFSDAEYGEAELAYNDFINLHPTNENVPYAVYQLGMCHYKQMYSIDRDQTETNKAIKEFERLITRFPDSKFSLMAEKILFLSCDQSRRSR